MIAKMNLINKNMELFDNQHSHHIPLNGQLFVSKTLRFQRGEIVYCEFSMMPKISYIKYFGQRKIRTLNFSNIKFPKISTPKISGVYCVMYSIEIIKSLRYLVNSPSRHVASIIFSDFRICLRPAVARSGTFSSPGETSATRLLSIDTTSVLQMLRLFQ